MHVPADPINPKLYPLSTALYVDVKIFNKI
jgi:hypothetical protein